MKNVLVKRGLSGLLMTLIALPVVAADVWVSDEFEVMMRSEPNNRARIVQQLRSGTKLELLKVDEGAGYTQVRTSGDKKGWVLSRYVKNSPTAKVRLPTVQQQLQKSDEQRNELRQQLADLKKEKQSLEREVADLQANNRSQQDTVDRITKLSSNTIQVDEQNQQLRQRLVDSELEIESLQNDNERLGSRADREWFLVGGAVLTLGLLLGLILPRISWRKKSSWSDF